MANPTPAAALRQYDQRFLDCRDLSHTWELEGFYRRPGDRRLYRDMLCTRCSTVRTDVWDSRGRRLSNRYRYPDGFKLPATRGEVTRDRVRREVLSRVEVHASRDELVASLPPRKRRALER